MTLGEKLQKMRKENNYTQEQLAELLGVSRQAISKWESDVTYPETDKLVRISNLYDCSLDYLIRDSERTMKNDHAQCDTACESKQKENEKSIFNFEEFSFTSKKTVFGMPLWHVGKHARGFIAIGFDARGIIAVGFKAKGILSLGVLAIGLLSMGFLSVGLISLGMLAVGLLSAGCFSVGIFTAGAISAGIISLGAIAIGDFSIGALAIGRYFALGDTAMARIAIGDTKAVGSVFELVGELSAENLPTVSAALDDIVPSYLSWAKKIIMLFL